MIHAFFKLTRRQWFVRHASDPYVKAARHENYRSRAVFKLIQINQKYRLLEGAKLILDLGAAPGGWSQVASTIVQAQNGSVIAVDLLEMLPIEGVKFIRGDFTNEDVAKCIQQLCQGRDVDVLLSYST